MPDPPKDWKPGDALPADDVNRIGKQLRVGEARPDDDTGSIRGSRSKVDFQEGPVEITEVQANDQYLAKPVYYSNDGDSWSVDEDVNPLEIDASDSNVSFSKEDRATVYFDSQRNKYLPIQPSVACNTVVDVHASAGTVQTERVATDDEYIVFALEQSLNGETNWHVVNRRVYSANASIGDRGSSMSGMGIYTFLIDRSPFYLRVTALSQAESLVGLDLAALRLEFKQPAEGIAHKITNVHLDDDATIAHNWRFEAEVQNDSDNRPKVSLPSEGNKIKIEIPEDTQWTVEAELAVRFEEKCCIGQRPKQIQIEVTGVVDRLCGNCPNLNGIYILDFDPDHDTWDCIWSASIGGVDAGPPLAVVNCIPVKIEFYFFPSGSANNGFVDIVNQDGIPMMSFFGNLGGSLPRDCDFDDFEMGTNFEGICAPGFVSKAIINSL